MNLVRGEIERCAAVARWLRRRPDDGGPGATPISYGRDQVALVWMFLGITAVEIAVVELVVPWLALRLVLLALGLYGMVVMAGFVAVNRTRPHLLTTGTLRLRCGQLADLEIPLAAVAGVAQDARDAGYGPILDGDVLSLGVGGRTQLTLTLAEPTALRAGKVAGVVRQVRLPADEPRAAAALLRERVSR